MHRREKKGTEKDGKAPFVTERKDLEHQSDEHVNEQNVLKHRRGKIGEGLHEKQSQILRFIAIRRIKEWDGKEIDPAEKEQRKQEGIAKFLMGSFDFPFVFMFKKDEDSSRHGESDEFDNQKDPFPEPGNPRQVTENCIEHHQGDHDG